MTFKKNFLLFIVTFLAFNAMIASKAFSQAFECSGLSNEERGNIRLCNIVVSMVTSEFLPAENISRLFKGKELEPTMLGIVYDPSSFDLDFGLALMRAMFGAVTYTLSLIHI